MNVKLDGIATFVQVVQSGSFAGAAGRLGLTRSAVGKTIARLEQRLDARLFHRTTRKQHLTDDGRAYYEHCLRALVELDKAEAALETGRREPAGRLRVGAPVLFGRHCVAPALQDLLRRHPRLELEIAFDDRIIDVVDQGYDLSVRIGELPDSATLVARRLGIQHMAICAAPSYLAAHGQPRRAEQLDGHAGIVYTRHPTEKSWLVRREDGRTMQPRIRGRLYLDDLQAIADAAVDGIGLAWLPCWLLAKYVSSGQLQLALDSNYVLPKDIYAVWPRTHVLPSRTRTAIDTLAATIPAMLGQHRRQAA